MVNNISILDKNKCFSCRSCEQSCPQNAITMKENNEGFLYPVVNKEKCINCGLCTKRCPALKEKKIDTKEKIGYAAWLKDDVKLRQSTSGGVFSGLAEQILEKKGIVFGAAYDENLQVQQIGIENIEELVKLKGSKYVESNTLDSFSKVRKELEADREVLYSGTPCQIAGLKAFLSKDYKNLVTIDLICHGVPSQKLFNKYVEWLENKLKDKITYYGFRDKDIGGAICGEKIKIISKEKSKTKIIQGLADPYYASFLRGETYRESCYNCPYANIKNRPADLTIGDFFEISLFNRNIDKKKGISLVILNTLKGENYFGLYSKIFHLLQFHESEYLPIKYNLRESSKRPMIRNTIYLDINKVSNENYYLKLKKHHFPYILKYKLKKIFFMLIPRRIKEFIKNIWKYRI